jgi:hypothetical protein
VFVVADGRDRWLIGYEGIKIRCFASHFILFFQADLASSYWWAKNPIFCNDRIEVIPFAYENNLDKEIAQNLPFVQPTQ